MDNAQSPTALAPIRVLVVDDHDMIRSSLAAVLLACDDMVQVGEAKNGTQALQLCEQLHPDVVLMDLVMPEIDGTTATRLIRERWPNIQVIALTSFGEEELIRGAIKAGAISYLLKNVSAEELAKAIRAARRGESTLSPEALKILTQPQDSDAGAR